MSRYSAWERRRRDDRHRHTARILSRIRTVRLTLQSQGLQVEQFTVKASRPPCKRLSHLHCCQIVAYLLYRHHSMFRVSAALALPQLSWSLLVKPCSRVCRCLIPTPDESRSGLDWDPGTCPEPVFYLPLGTLLTRIFESSVLSKSSPGLICKAKSSSRDSGISQCKVLTLHATTCIIFTNQ